MGVVEHFTPISGLIGGALIGLAAVLLMALNGRIAGISGIVDGVLSPLQPDFSWKAAFAGGLVVSPLLYSLCAGVPDIVYPHGAWWVAAGGLLVGFGTRLGNGCTSGHGICGLSRQSPRSLASVVTFMALGVLTATLLRPLLP